MQGPRINAEDRRREKRAKYKAKRTADFTDYADSCSRRKTTIRRDNRITADFVKLRKTLNVAKKEREPRISRINAEKDNNGQ